MNFNYVSFESILIILHEINMIIVTHPTTFVHCFRVLFLFFSGTHCKGVSKQLCVYHLYINVFLAQTRIRSHLGCIFLFRNSFQYPQSNRDSKRVSNRLGVRLSPFPRVDTRFNTHNQNAFANAFLELLRLSSISQNHDYEYTVRPRRKQFCYRYSSSYINKSKHYDLTIM